MKTMEMKQLEYMCLDIKKMGWIKSVVNNNSGIGLTFEALIGKQIENFEFPDYNGIEIKARHIYSKCPITLFHATLEGEEFFEIQRVLRLYGYPDAIIKNKNVLFGSINAIEKRFIGLWYQFQLEVDWHEKKVFLCIYSWDDILIDRKSFWTFDLLEKKLYRKLQTLAVIEGYKKRVSNDWYFKYKHYDFYLLKNFCTFLKLIEHGKININFSVGIFRNGKRAGSTYDHGTGFRIEKDNLELLYTKITD